MKLPRPFFLPLAVAFTLVLAVVQTRGAAPFPHEASDLKVDPVPLTEIVKNRQQASELVDRVGFDN